MVGTIGKFEMIAGVPKKGSADINVRIYAERDMNEKTAVMIRKQLQERGADFAFGIIVKSINTGEYASAEEIEAELKV